MRQFVIRLLVSVLVVGLMSGVTLAQGKKPKIAWCPAIDDPFYYMIGKGIADKCKELGLELFVAEYPKAWGPEVQVPILEAVAARGDIDVIITGPTSKEALPSSHPSRESMTAASRSSPWIPTLVTVTTRNPASTPSRSPLSGQITSRVV